MSQEYLLSLNATEIDYRLNNALLYTEQTLTGKQRAQVRENIDISMIINNRLGQSIFLNDASNSKFYDLKLYGKTIQNGTPTADVPIPLKSVGKNVNVTVCGKNLVDIFNDNMNVTRSGGTSSNYPNIVNTDGSLVVNIADVNTYGLGFSKKLFAGQTVTISYTIDSIGNGSALVLVIYDTNNYASTLASKRYTTTGAVSATFTPTSDSTYMFGWYVGSGTSPCGALIHDLQLEYGSMATEYEQYKDGGSMTVSTPNGLPGIPVSSGGNHTDESGQQWICDEVDFEKGLYIQRIKSIKLADMTGGYNGNNFWSTYATDKKIGSTNLLCSHYPVRTGYDDFICKGSSSESHLFIYDSRYTDFNTLKAEMGDTEIIYELATPIETALSTDELIAYAALHTNYPNTTVFNNGGADMEIKYIADTKLYIDNKFNELLTLINNT